MPVARSASQVAPRSPDGWVDLANRELANITGSYLGRVSNDAKIDHALRATECTLKACLWKTHKWLVWPARKKPYLYLYNHDIAAMLAECGTLENELRLGAEHWLSWQVLVNAIEKQLRYSTTSVPDIEANSIIKSARHPDQGVIPWLLSRYRQMM